MDASIPAAPDALLGGRLPWGAVPSTTQAEADPVVELAMDDELQSGRSRRHRECNFCHAD
jgi:hypothetical protein